MGFYGKGRGGRYLHGGDDFFVFFLFLWSFALAFYAIVKEDDMKFVDRRDPPQNVTVAAERLQSELEMRVAHKMQWNTVPPPKNNIRRPDEK